MRDSLADHYYLKAFDAYPYCLVTVSEYLDYALSCDDYHAPANVLKGRVEMEYLRNFKAARHYYEMALLAEPEYVDTYEYYTLLCLWTGAFGKLESLLKASIKVPGIDVHLMRFRKAKMLEMVGRLEDASIEFEKLVLTATSTAKLDRFKKERKRVRKLIKMRARKSE